MALDRRASVKISMRPRSYIFSHDSLTVLLSLTVITRAQQDPMASLLCVSSPFFDIWAVSQDQNLLAMNFNVS